MDFERIPKKDIFCKFECGYQSGNHRKFTKYGLFGAAKSCRKQLLEIPFIYNHGSEMKYDVFYAKSPDYSRQNLKPALEKVLSGQIRNFGGVSGKRIMLKPNLLAWRHKDDIACVHPAVIVETAKLFLDAGAAKVALLENPGVQTAPSIIHSMGIRDDLKKMNVSVANFVDYRRIAEPDNVKFHNLELAAEFLDFDAIADIAKAKTHAMMILTLCVKNLFGLVKGSERMGWHLAVGKDFAKFADMLLDIYLTVKPRFNILDAVVCMEGNGPGSGTPAGRGFVAGCSDALALDASAAEILGVPQLLLLRNAAERGILPEFENAGDIPEADPLKRPDPPGIMAEWGVTLPPFLKNIMRDFVVSKPKLNPALCIGCGLCAQMCPPQSLKIVDGKPVFDLPDCIRCYCCQEHCPKGAITPYKTFPMKFAEKLEDTVRALFGTNAEQGKKQTADKRK